MRGKRDRVAIDHSDNNATDISPDPPIGMCWDCSALLEMWMVGVVSDTCLNHISPRGPSSGRMDTLIPFEPILFGLFSPAIDFFVGMEETFEGKRRERESGERL